MKLHYRIGWVVALGLVKLLWGFRVEGRGNIPTNGPVIIASNHISNWDPLLVGLGCPREMHFLAKRELFANRAFAALITAYNAIPLDREGGDRKALRIARRLLGEDRVLLMFPEGTRSLTGKLGKGRPGVAFIAAATGAPVVPACIIGSADTRRAWRRRGAVRVAFGEPVTHEGPAGSVAYEETTERIMDVIAGLQARLERETRSG